MGYYRIPQPTPLDRAAVTRFLAQEIAFEMRVDDPFGVDSDCLSPAGHVFTGSCGDVVCVHCGKVVWQ
jgi:hypothetical protein